MTADRPPTHEAARDGDATSPEKVDRVAREFREAGRPFALVTVVRREPPVSATVGDRALVTADGDLVGWIGGVGCAQSLVVREGTKALQTGEPVLLGLAPDPETVSRPGLDAFPMTCHSGGVLELFVDPILPTPRLVVVGDSPLAHALARLANELTYAVTAVADAATAPRVREVIAPDDDTLVDRVAGAEAVVVATMGSFDELGLETGLRAGVPYVGLVASDRRAASLFDDVADRLGVDAAVVADSVVVPAGLDIGAETPEEIALSVFAELVAVRHGLAERSAATNERLEDAIRLHHSRHDHDRERSAESAELSESVDSVNSAESAADIAAAVDPVCGMHVVVGEAAATVEHDGETYHFCGQGCADAFADDPERFLPEEEAR